MPMGGPVGFTLCGSKTYGSDGFAGLLATQELIPEHMSSINVSTGGQGWGPRSSIPTKQVDISRGPLPRPDDTAAIMVGCLGPLHRGRKLPPCRHSSRSVFARSARRPRAGTIARTGGKRIRPASQAIQATLSIGGQRQVAEGAGEGAPQVEAAPSIRRCLRNHLRGSSMGGARLLDSTSMDCVVRCRPRSLHSRE